MWRVADQAIDWFVLRNDCYERLKLDTEGRYRSEVFPGLWLDPAALVRGDMARHATAWQQGWHRRNMPISWRNWLGDAERKRRSWAVVPPDVP